MLDSIRIFIGYDPREAIAYHVLVHSLISRSSLPLTITPLALRNLGKEMWRERDPLQSTDFAFSRFLTPYLSGYEGWSIFMDSDILCLDDIAKLWSLRDETYAVMCVKHEHVPTSTTKFLGAVQTQYPKKNWSSVMMFQNARCRALTPDYVNTATGLDLHRFNWLGDDAQIGGLPAGWNYLVGYTNLPREEIHMLHYTEGGPYFDDYRSCEFASDWFAERESLERVPIAERHQLAAAVPGHGS